MTQRPIPPHDHAECERLLARLDLRGIQRLCNIEEEEPFTAVHAMHGPSRYGVLPYCESCFIDIYGPHDCKRLGCQPSCKGED